MALTTAELIGTPVHASEFDLNDALEGGKKATGGGSAIAVGRVVFHTGSSGLWAIATAGSTGRMGIIPKLAPINTDAGADLKVAEEQEQSISLKVTAQKTRRTMSSRYRRQTKSHYWSRRFHISRS